jgi:hypothetical protein
METATTAMDEERRTMNENSKRVMYEVINRQANKDAGNHLNKDEIGIDLSEIRRLSKDQEDVILLLELSRLRKKGVITLETFMKTVKEWKI